MKKFIITYQYWNALDTDEEFTISGELEHLNFFTNGFYIPNKSGTYEFKIISINTITCK